MITLELPTAPPSLNQWQRMHWAKRSRTDGRILAEVSSALCQRVAPKSVLRVSARYMRETGALISLAAEFRAKGHRRVKITRRGSRTLDHDNLVGGCKPLVDALVKVGLIENDTPAPVYHPATVALE